MQVKSTQKFMKTSPRKLRLVADIARQLSPVMAVEVLPHTGKRAAEPLIKVIKTAIANAKVMGISEDRLFFEQLQINDGPRLKRGRAVSRGRWHPYQRKMSHVVVVLGVREELPEKKSKSGNKPLDKKVVKNKKPKVKSESTKSKKVIKKDKSK